MIMMVLCMASFVFGAVSYTPYDPTAIHEGDTISAGIISFEGDTADAYETFVYVVDPTADANIIIPAPATAGDFYVVLSTLAENRPDIANGIWLASNGIFFEGATADACEAKIVATDPTADTIWTIPVAAAGTYSFMSSTLATNAPNIANSVTGGTNQLIFEGSGVDAYETVITATNPTADVNFILPVIATGNYGIMTSTLTTNAPDIANSIWGGTNQIIAEGSTADACETIITFTNPTTGDKTITFPAVTGQVQLSSAAVALDVSDDLPALTVGLSNVYTDTVVTDNNDQTITFSGAGTSGDEITIIFTTDTGGSNDEVVTFESTLVTSTGTLTLADATAKSYLVTFISNGTRWYEKSRTAISTSP